MIRYICGLLAVSLLLLINSCGPRAPRENFTTGTALIGTSDAVFELAAYVAQQYQSIYNSAFVSVYRHQTQALLDSLISGSAEEVFIDRALSPAETLVFSERQMKLYTYPVCYFPVYLLVDSSLGVAAIDSAGLRGILTGQTTNWKRFGGQDVQITPYLPYPGTGGWTALMDYFGELDSIVAVPCTTDAFMLEQAAGDRGALLVFSHQLEELDNYRRLRWAEGKLRVPANVKTILERPQYPFKMVFTYVTTRNKIDVASGYLTFLVENNGQKMVMQQGYRPATVPVRVIHLKE